MDVTIDPPLKYSWPQSEEEVLFSDLDTLVSWAQRQNDFWVEFVQGLGNTANTDPWRMVSGIEQPFGRILHMANDYRRRAQSGEMQNASEMHSNERDNFQSVLNEIRQSGYFSADSAEANKIKDIALSNRELAAALVLVFAPKLRGNQMVRTLTERRMDDAQLATLYEANFIANSLKAGREGRNRYERKALDDLKAQFEAEISMLRNQLREHSSEFNNMRLRTDRRRAAIRRVLGREIRRTDEAMQAMEKRYRTELTGEAPVTYWIKRAKEHQRAFWVWGTFFGIGVGVALFSLGHFFGDLRDFLGEGLNLGRIGLIILFATPVIWVLRIFARQIASNIHMRHDALARATMTQSFLALMDEQGHIKEQDRIIILNALFRPTPESSPDDGIPQHLLEAVLHRITGGGDGR